MAKCPADQLQHLSLQGDYDSHGIGNSNTSHIGGGYSDISAGLATNSLQAKTDPFQHGSSFIDGATSGGTFGFYNGFRQEGYPHGGTVEGYPHGGTVEGGYTDLMTQSSHDDCNNTRGLLDTMQEGNLLGNLDTGHGIVVKHVDGVDNDYFMSSGQPLLDITSQNQDFQLHPPISKQMDLMGDDSNIYSESFSNSKMVKEADFEPERLKTVPLVEIMSSSLYENDDFEGFSSTKENIDLMNQEFYEQEHPRTTLSPGQSEDGSSWRPEMDPERSRRSTSPERELFDSGSVSLGLGQDMTESLYSDPDYGGVFSPEMDQERSRSLSHERGIYSPTIMMDSVYRPEDVGQVQPQEMAPEDQTTEPSELHPGVEKTELSELHPEVEKTELSELHPEVETHQEHASLAVDEAKRPTTLQKDTKIPSPQKLFEAKSSISKKIAIDYSKSKDMSRSSMKSPQLRMGHIPRPKSAVATISDVSPNKPEWNTYQREYGPATFPTRKKEKDTKTPTTPTRPSTAPLERKKKDASSDSGVEEDRVSRKSFEENKKKYGTDTKNENYKPGGGNVRIFSSKVEVKNVESRIDTKPPKTSSPKKEPTTPESSKSPTPTPNYKTVQSKVGSMNNLKHSPGGGNVKIASTKLNFSNVTSKVGSKDNLTHRPGGGEKKIVSTKVSWNADPKVGSMEMVQHTPGGGKVTIHSEKVQWNAAPKVGSLDNATYSPGGGNVKIISNKISWDGKPKVGSLDNVKHSPGGGNVTITSEKLSWSSVARIVARNDEYSPGGGNVKINHHPVQWNALSKVGSLENVHYTRGGGSVKVTFHPVQWNATPRVGSLDNLHYTPGGGKVTIVDEKVNWKAESKMETFDKISLTPGGGNVKIESQKLGFKETAQPKVGSMEKVGHRPGGGDKKIETQKLSFKENATARTDHKRKDSSGDKK